MLLNINGEDVEVDVASDTPLLWVLRDHLGLKGTRFGCGVGQCGACTVHFNGRPARSCVLPVSAARGSQVRTIEDLAKDHQHPVVKAWIEHGVPQCGYCQSGQIMAAAGLLDQTPHPTDADIDAYMSNICRCATYDRIRAAIKSAAARRAAKAAPAGADEGDADLGGER